MFPTHRPRRLRTSQMMRSMVRETHLRPQDFIYPLFVEEGADKPIPIQAMPGQYRHSVDSLLKEAEKAVDAGVLAVLLFGIPKNKDEMGRGAWVEDGIVQKATRAIKARQFPLLVVTDVCMCEYTSHGHCGVIHSNDVDNDPSLELLEKTAISQAEAGADIVAPSDMMDGRVGRIRRALDENSYERTAIMSYAAKYASGFYGPFREAAGSAPQFGDRQTYQMDPANVKEALKEVQMDIDEGADMIMVKPALAYLDVISKVRQMTNLPVAAYNVSGEYAMIEYGAKAGIIDRERIIKEVLTSIKRAGADLILTYHALEAAAWSRAG